MQFFAFSGTPPAHRIVAINATTFDKVDNMISKGATKGQDGRN